MGSFLLIGIIILSGYLAGVEKNRRFNIAKSFLIVAAKTIACSLSFVLFMILIYKTPLSNILIADVESLFVVILLVAVIDGIILYHISRIIFPKLNISNQVLTLCEYIIQWSLIYITIYQVLFDNILKNAEFKSIIEISNLNIANPSDLIIAVLPSLISTWISVILYKFKENTL